MCVRSLKLTVTHGAATREELLQKQAKECGEARRLPTRLSVTPPDEGCMEPFCDPSPDDFFKVALLGGNLVGMLPIPGANAATIPRE